MKSVIRHTARHHDHTGFRATAPTFTRVTPAPGNPLYERRYERTETK
ncbi:hypothetical protein [Streptomyces sp. NBC_00648]